MSWSNKEKIYAYFKYHYSFENTKIDEAMAL